MSQPASPTKWRTSASVILVSRDDGNNKDYKESEEAISKSG